MIMPKGQQLLLPANPVFIWGSLLSAMTLDMLQNMALWGRAAWQPELLALVLGQHALAYTVLVFLAIGIHRRLLWFSVPSQAAQVFPLFAVAHALTLCVRLLAGDDFPGGWIALAPVLEALLWPVVSVLLLLPQRQAPDPDANRPL